MKNILAITKANLRKDKSQAIGLLAFALIAALLLNIGLLLMVRYGDYFETRAEELHSPHYVLIENKNLYKQSQADYIKNYPGVTEVETESALVNGLAEIPYNNGKTLASIIYLNAGTSRNMNDLELIEGSVPEASDEICLPYMFNVGGGYEIGDKFTVNVDGAKTTYKVCGFTEEIAFGSPSYNTYQVYLSASGYERVLEKYPDWECMILRARMQDPANSGKLLIGCLKEFTFKSDAYDSGVVSMVEWNDIITARTAMSRITSIVMVLFAVLIVLVSMLVIRFRIRNSIEESMTNIGALKAVGYTGRQLLWATVLQFCAVSAVGAVAGVGASYGLLPFVSQVLKVQSAMDWSPGFDMMTSLISFIAVVLLALSVAWLSARRIKKLQPLAALRQGLVTHSFKRNHFALDHSRGSLSLLLAMKSSLQAKGQMIMIFVIVAAVSFMSVAGVSIYDNIGLHPDTFGKLVAGEVPDAMFTIKDADDAENVLNYIEQSKYARKTLYFNQNFLVSGDINLSNFIVDDFGLLEGTMLYDGRYPKHDNEVVIGGNLAQIEGKIIGDKIELTKDDNAAEYLIVGFMQVANNNGLVSAMTVKGMRRIQSDYKPTGIYVYLEDNTKTADFIKYVEKEHSDVLSNSTNIQELMEAQLGVYGTIFSAVAFAILGVTILVIIIVLYLMLKTVILRRRRELGIQKALGFTTFQLMNQFVFNFIPIIMLGVVAGGLGGIFGFNALFVVVVRRMGIMTAAMPAPIDMTIVVCVGLVIIAYIFAMLISWRIRKISAYALVTE
jgi:Predicted ABC-type transport system involved in lysophospholipase L1 biosynthesis, permease component